MSLFGFPLRFYFTNTHFNLAPFYFRNVLFYTKCYTYVIARDFNFSLIQSSGVSVGVCHDYCSLLEKYYRYSFHRLCFSPSLVYSLFSASSPLTSPFSPLVSSLIIFSPLLVFSPGVSSSLFLSPRLSSCLLVSPHLSSLLTSRLVSSPPLT